MQLRNLTIPGGAAFAPMAGLSDAACRRLMADHGAAWTVSEMASAKAITFGDRKSLALLRDPDPHGLYAVQLFGSEPELLGDGDHEELMASKEWSIQEIAWLLAIGFGTVWAATGISSVVFGEGFRSAGRILLITTFSIILAQVPAIRKLRGNFDLGLFVALLFLVTIGFAVDLQQFFGSTFYITLFCFCVIACSILLHLLITRLLKVRFEYVLLSIVGCISDGPTAALIASSAQWKTLINIGLLMGVLAGALGNYVGIGVAYAIRALIGA